MTTQVTVIVDDSDPNVEYSGDWVANTTVSVGPRGQGALYGTLHETNSNSLLTFSFNGTFVSVMAQTLPTSVPKWECFIDSIKLLSVSFTNGLDNLPICSETLDDGAHTLIVVANATQESPFWFDYIKYSPSTSVDLDQADTVLDPEKSAIFGQGWEGQGSSGSMTTRAGSTLSVNFSGVSMTWLGIYNNSLSHPSTTATYAIDGQTPITFSVINPASIDAPIMFDQIVFQTSNYSTGTHHLEVVYEGNSQTAPLTVTSLIVQKIAESKLSANITSTAGTSPSNFGSPMNKAGRQSHNVGTIAGGVIGSISLFSLLVIAVMFLRKQAKRNHDSASMIPSDLVQPFNHNPLLASGYNSNSSNYRSSKQVDLPGTATGNSTQIPSVLRPSKARTLAQAAATALHLQRPPAGLPEVPIPPRFPPPPPEILVHLDSGLRLSQPDRSNIIEVPPIYSPI